MNIKITVYDEDSSNDILIIGATETQLDIIEDLPWLFDTADTVWRYEIWEESRVKIDD